jgi:hypothetical protein
MALRQALFSIFAMAARGDTRPPSCSRGGRKMRREWEGDTPWSRDRAECLNKHQSRLTRPPPLFLLTIPSFQSRSSEIALFPVVPGLL